MEGNKGNSFLKLLLLVLACYRLANLISEDDGPADVFRKLRAWTDGKRKEEQDKFIAKLDKSQGWGAIKEYEYWKSYTRGKWANIDDGIRCPYCVGVWAAALVAILVYTGIGEFVVFVLAIAGGQSVLQGMRKE